MWIKDRVELICDKYDTRDPFEIAAQRNIIVLFESLGTIRGYYNRSYRQQFIHINDKLNRIDSKFVCAHELAHAIIHPDLNTAFLREKTFFSINKIEAEAKKFALFLLFSDEEIWNLRRYSSSQVAMILGVDEESALYRLKNLNN